MLVQPAGAVPPTSSARLALQRGLGEWGHEQAMEALSERPDDPDAQSYYAGILAKAGCPAEAVAAFELAFGSEWYESSGIALHADALREVGRGKEAAALRDEGLLLENSRPNARLLYEVDRLDDLRTAGAWSEALEAAERLEAGAPSSALAHAAIADLMHDLGDEEAMIWHLFLAEQVGVPNARLELLKGWLALEEGRLDAAWEHSLMVRKLQGRLPELWVLRVEIHRQEGLPELAVETLERKRFDFQEHPQLMAAEARALIDLGELERADALVRRIEVLYPELESTRDARAQLQAARKDRLR